MTSRYQDTARRAYDTVRSKGARVTFVSAHESPDRYDDATARREPPIPITVPGYAVRVAGDPERYQALGLVVSEAPTLLFAPDTFGRVPAVGALVTFGGATYTVRAIEPTAPDGVAIVAKVVIVGGGVTLALVHAALDLPALELEARGALRFGGTVDLALPLLTLDARGDNGVLFSYAPGDPLTGATFTRASTATYTAEV